MLFNGLWADPDSEKDRQEAFLGVSEEHRLPQMMREVQGPCILPKKELGELYQEVTEDLSDEEGDPLTHRISGEDFLILSRGAARGDSWCEEKKQISR